MACVCRANARKTGRIWLAGCLQSASAFKRDRASARVRLETGRFPLRSPPYGTWTDKEFELSE